MLSRQFIAALWSPDGNGLTSWLSFVMFNYVFVTFPYGILGQVRYLIVSIPDLCHLSYFLRLFDLSKESIDRACSTDAVDIINTRDFNFKMTQSTPNKVNELMSEYETSQIVYISQNTHLPSGPNSGSQ